MPGIIFFGNQRCDRGQVEDGLLMEGKLEEYQRAWQVPPSLVTARWLPGVLPVPLCQDT